MYTINIRYSYNIYNVLFTHVLISLNTLNTVIFKGIVNFSIAY
ncbi:hypothetical protein CNEO4_280013 [Clostridium neonatale]|nr:hypothetical protein CNEO3_100029 [Clostridium neonatale]CAI3577424.1 hypothetical protein CNEO4_160030 [Clostridium neonatale]CAI3601845.1 hypothetical protein CNEO4_280013 [Clostridium neonatale]